MTAVARGPVDLRMKPFDRLLQRWRVAKTAPYIGTGDRVLDIGSADGALFRRFESRIGEGLGIDPGLSREIEGDRWRLVPGWFPEDLPECPPFDVITMLALLEHVPEDQQPRLARHCARLLKPGGHLLVTVPSLLVDPIASVLMSLRIMTAVALHQHYGFDPGRTPEVLSVDGLRLVKRRRFQLGLNNLFVFRKEA